MNSTDPSTRPEAGGRPANAGVAALAAIARHPWLTTLAVVAVGVVVLLWLWDWNWFKGPIERQVQSRTGRELQIGGDLDVDLGWVPTIRADEVTFGNAGWSKEPTMASAQRVEFDIELRPLFGRDVRIPELRLAQPVLNLEVGPQRVGNWKFGKPGGMQPQFRRIWIDDGKLAFLDAARKTDIQVDVASDQPKGDEAAPPITAKGGGRWSCAIARAHTGSMRAPAPARPMPMRAAPCSTRCGCATSI